MNIAVRLIIGFGLIMSLTLFMYGVFSWGTDEIRRAYENSARKIAGASLLEDETENQARKLVAVRELKSELGLIVGRIQGAMLNNAEVIESGWLSENRSAIERFISQGADDIGRSGQRGDRWGIRLQDIDSQIRTSIQRIEELWRPRHEGLTEALNALKRTELNWTLKVANMLFIQSSLGELIYEEIGETPLEEFKAGPVYGTYEADYPQLKAALENASGANAMLYTGVDKLDDLAFAGKWEEARLYYRDHFPSNIKSIMVDLDNIINLENKILQRQGLAVKHLEEELRPRINALLTELDQVEQSLEAVLQQSNLVVSEATAGVLLSHEQLEQKIAGIDRIGLMIAMVVIVIGLVCAIQTTRSIIRPLKLTVDMLEGMQSGELDRRLNFTSGDELGTMGRALDSFADDLKNQILSAFEKLGRGDFTFSARGLIRQPLDEVNNALNRFMGQIRVSGSRLLDCSEKISITSQTLAKGANQQSAALSELVVTLENVVARSHDNNRGAESTSTLSRELLPLPVRIRPR